MTILDPVDYVSRDILFNDFIGSTLSEFHYGVVRGICFKGDNRIEIITIRSLIEGQGYLRDFIKHCQSTYHYVAILGVMSPVLEMALTRYDFNYIFEGAPITLPSLYWEKPS